MAEPPQKRFRYATYTQQINNITVDTGKVKPLGWEDQEGESSTQVQSTPFRAELDRLSLLDLTLPFQELQQIVQPLTTTLPITLHNLPALASSFHDFYVRITDGKDQTQSGLDSALQLHRALFETTLGEAVTYLAEATRDICRIASLPALDPKLVERAFSTLSLSLRVMASTLLKAESTCSTALAETWSALRPYLRLEHKRYIRRCAADAWVGVVRKARGDGLHRLSSLLLADDGEGMEAVWAHSLRGTTGQLHSRALPVYDILLDDLSRDPNPSKTSTMIKVTTALVHHTTATSIVPVVETILNRISTSSSDAVPTFLRLLSTLLFVRKGKRFPEPLLRPTMLKLVEALPSFRQATSEWRRAMMEAVVGCLMAGKLQQWLSPGVTLIQHYWDAITIEEHFAFVNALIKLRWAGLEQFVIPHIARTILPSLNTEPLHALVLLNNLAEAGLLTDSLTNVQGGRWRKSLVSALAALLESATQLDHTGSGHRVVIQLLHLLPTLPNEGPVFVTNVVKIVDSIRLRHVSVQSARDDFALSAWNDSHLLAAALAALEAFDGMQDFEADCKHTITRSLPDILAVWSWNREVLEKLASFSERWSSFAALDSQHLYVNLLASDSAIRSSSLRILTSIHSSSPKLSELWTSCLQIESSEMSLRNVRERTSEIARLGRLLADKSAEYDIEVIDKVITYLLSQLKVNFRPLYTETIKMLGLVGAQHGEILWQVVWREIDKITTVDSATVLDIGSGRPGWAQPGSTAKSVPDEEEDEPEYRCHNAEKFVASLGDSWNLSSREESLDAVEVGAQVSTVRLDVINYEAQLLSTLGEINLITEKHTRVVVPAFFVVAAQSENGDDSMLSSHLSTRQRQQRTMNWMELFAKFVNPKAAFRSDELYALYLRILSKGDAKLQGLAVSCIATFKSPKILPYEQNLRNLLEESKFRDELARFILGVDGEVVNPQHREEIIPITIRLLYGILTARRGRSSSQGLAARKRAVLTSLSGCTSDELSTLINLMLEPFETESTELQESAGRQQLGFLSLLSDVLRYLAPQTKAHWRRLISTTVGLIGRAQAQIDKEADVDSVDEIEADEEEGDAEGKGAAPVRQIRSTGIKRLVQFPRASVDFDFEPFLPRIFSIVITPRLAKLDVENTQAPSGVLDLIAAIAALPDAAPSLVQFDEQTLPKTFDCLTAVKVKPAVIARVFDIIDSLLERDTLEILLSSMRPLLDNVIRYVEARTHSANDDLTKRLLSILSRISAVVTDGHQAQQLASLLCPMLRQSGRQQPEKLKVHVLQTLQRLFSISPDFSDTSSEFFTRSYDLLSNLLQTVYLPTTRRAVISALETFSGDVSLAPSIKLAADLNAYSAKRLEEPDFDRRLTAFATLNDSDIIDLPQSVRQWVPLLRTALFQIKDPEELSLRTNSSSLLKRFIDLVGTQNEGPFVDAVHHIILPGLRQSIRNKLELVRSEAMIVIAHAVHVCDGIPSLVELRSLTGDDDVNFFANISHIQVHRRARALRRLRDVIQENDIRETTIANIFLPILEHIISGSTEVTDHHFVNEAILSVGSLSAKLRWGKYNGVLSRYIKLGNVKSAQQKLYIRTVSSIIDNFHFDLLGETALDVEEVDEEDEEAVEVNTPETKRISEIVLNRLLPSLTKFVSQKDENEDSIRIPLALPTVKLAKQLSDEVASNEILRVITIVCSILRSRDQDTRDIARDTMGKIAVFLGPEWLSRVLAEIKTALQRGPQLHVAAVVTHSILVLATSEAADRFSDLDDAVNDAIRISAEVVWGESGKDAADEGYKTKMREVRGATSRGYDTFQLLSRLVSPAKISTVIAPIREVMHASQSVKTMAHVDEALRRVALGLNANPRVPPEDVLTLCHSLISGNSAYLQPKRKAAPTSQTLDAYRVEMKRNKAAQDDFYHLNAYKFVAFGLDLFVTAFRRGKFEFENLDILSRLGPLVNAIGNTLYSPTASVLLLALKASAAIARCPIPQVETALPSFVTNIFRIIKQQGGTAETEVSQTALKTLAVILRDCKDAQLTDSQLRYLLSVISPDLEETDRQAAIFAVLRSVITKKMVVPEIYDLMGSVSSIMVTNQSTHVQDLCRGVLMAFLLDYPQGKGRIRSQMTFLAQNLDYVYESGRISVMEFLSTVFIKFTDELVQEYADLFFVALVAVIANDEVEKCRRMAGALLQVLFARLSVERLDKMVPVLKSWVEARAEQSALAGASLAVFGLLADVKDVDAGIVAEMISCAVPVIHDSALALAKAESDDSTFASIDLDYTVPHHALVAVGKALKVTSEVSVGWNDVIEHLLFPHDWVRLAAARAIGAIMTASPDKLDDEQCLDVARKGCILLQGSKTADGESLPVDGKLADQLVKLLWNIAKRWASNAETSNGHDEVDVEADEETSPTHGGSLAWLMSRMSFVARHVIVHRPPPNAVSVSSTHWAVPLMSILRFFAGVLEHLDVRQARRFLLHVLNPIHRILDESGDLAVEAGSQMDDLKQLATEVRDFVQTKVGTTEFSKVWEGMRRKVTEKREERRDARNRLAVSDPKAWAERKSKKGAIKKDSKKRRVKAFAEGRVQSKHMQKRK